MAAVKQEGLTFLIVHAFDFPDEDHMIASRMFCHEIAGEVRQRAFQKRNASLRPDKPNAQLAARFEGLFWFREMLGNRLLIVAENAHAEAPLRFQKRKKPSLMGDTDQHKHRVKRNRGKGIGGHAMHLTWFALDGDDGDASGKGPGNSAEQRWAQSRGRHRDCNFKIA